MPAFVIPYRCDGCGQCVEACPSGIIHIDPHSRKSFNVEPEMCWECYPCAKACPQDAIEIRGYSDFVPVGAKLTCKRDTVKNVIYWTVKFRNGRILNFTFPIRTTPWGSVKSPTATPPPTTDDLRSPYLGMESEYLGVSKLPIPAPMGK